MTLSFDNGPDPEVTPQVLDVLDQHGIKASFFVIGDKLRDPGRWNVCREACERGHWIGNHTVNHLTPLGLNRDPSMSEFEIEETQRLLGCLSHKKRFFRPFGGGGHLNGNLLDKTAFETLKRGKYTCVLWNVVPRDWEVPKDWPDIALAMIDQVDRPLVVLHDIYTNAMNELDDFIRKARDRGITFEQEFPEDCVPIVEGKMRCDVSPYLSS